MSKPVRAGAPVTEIEITPAMLAAGVEKFSVLGDCQIATAETVAFAIFTAMVEASPFLRSFRLLDRTECRLK